MTTSDEKCTREIKYRFAVAKATLNRKNLFTSKWT
jgi:hypothetical protein